MDVERIKKKYRRNARFYDFPEGPLGRLRAEAVSRLALKPGQVVLDFGCGTGLSFALLEQAIGRTGRIIGVELSPDMLARAHGKVARHGWANVTLIEADAEEVDLPPESADAVLCFFTHDIMNSRRAVERAVSALRLGGRFVVAGGKRAHGWRGVLVNPVMLACSLPFITNLSGIARPWMQLESFLGSLNIEERLWGSAYIVSAVKELSLVERGA